MSISIVEGRPGTGKSVFLTVMILRYLNAGHEVYSNVDIKLKETDKRFHKFHLIQSLEECTRLRKGKIVLDEVQVYLNSRNWDKLPVKFQLFLQQHRHRGLDILGATQSVKRADVIFRELVQYFYVVSKVFTISVFGNVYGLFILREYDADALEVDKVDRYKYRVTRFPQLMVADPFIFRVYDTHQYADAINDDDGKIEVIRRRIVEKKVVGYELIGRSVE